MWFSGFAVCSSLEKMPDFKQRWELIKQLWYSHMDYLVLGGLSASKEVATTNMAKDLLVTYRGCIGCKPQSNSIDDFHPRALYSGLEFQVACDWPQLFLKCLIIAIWFSCLLITWTVTSVLKHVRFQWQVGMWETIGAFCSELEACKMAVVSNSSTFCKSLMVSLN